LCHNYDYSSHTQKLKLFPTTIKDDALCWFIGLGTDTMKALDEMRKLFFVKYHDYCANQGMREKLFKVKQKEYERLQDYLEIFHYTIKRER